MRRDFYIWFNKGSLMMMSFSLVIVYTLFFYIQKSYQCDPLNLILSGIIIFALWIIAMQKTASILFEEDDNE